MVYPTGTVIFNVSQIKNSQRTGSSPDDVHVPKLWYYDELLFLEDQDIPRKSHSIESVLDNNCFASLRYDMTQRLRGNSFWIFQLFIGTPRSQKAKSSRQPLVTLCLITVSCFFIIGVIISNKLK
jgi:hypothetical protein